MKVMCIVPVRTVGPGCNISQSIIRVGGIYTVVDIFEQDGATNYELEEHLGYAYEAKLFAPLSEIDETEMVRYKPAAI